jgi:ketosteroid isomerase-like protein
MSAENIELTKRGYAAFRSRDIEAVVAITDPDIEFTSLTRESEGTTYRGHEGLREFFASLLEVLPDWRPTLEMAEDHGDLVLAKALIEATPPGGVVPVKQVMWHVIRMRNGLAVRWDFFRTEEEARAALRSTRP